MRAKNNPSKPVPLVRHCGGRCHPCGLRGCGVALVHRSAWPGDQGGRLVDFGHLCRPGAMRPMSRRTSAGVANVSPCSGDAGGERFHRAGKFQRRPFFQRRRDVQLLQERRQVLRPHRRPRRQAAGLRPSVHVRRLSSAAVPGSISRRPDAEFRCGVGFAQQRTAMANAGSTSIPTRR